MYPDVSRHNAESLRVRACLAVKLTGLSFGNDTFLAIVLFHERQLTFWVVATLYIYDMYMCA